MLHDTDLIATIAVGLSVAFLGGFIATKLRLPPIVGYLVGGIAVGPYTPGFTADAEIAPQLAEIGVILLMFGVGTHFSLAELLAVRRVALPGALAQIAVASSLGVGIALLWGWDFGAGVVLGFALAVASTVVLLRALMLRGELDSVQGRIAVGWLIVEDLFIVFVLVLLPALAGPLGGVSSGDGDILQSLGITIAKVALLVVGMLIVGGRVVPWLLIQVARTGSREMFTLTVLAVALGIAFGASSLFDVSLALGAFLAGLVISEPDISHRAAAEALPLQDAFAVLFFVSIGMIFDPHVLLDSPEKVVGIIAIIMLGKTLAAGLIVLILGYPLRIALTVAAALSQIGEFSFIIAGVGEHLELLPEDGLSLILSGAIFSITLNPLMFTLIVPLERVVRNHPWLSRALERADVELPEGEEGPQFAEHLIICGYGRVGEIIGQALDLYGASYVIIDDDRTRVERLREQGNTVVYGDASNAAVLERAGLENARALVIAVPDPPATRFIVEHARRVNPDIHIIVRTHSERERDRLERLGVSAAIMGEMELALQMASATLNAFDVDTLDSAMLIQGLRGGAGSDTVAQRRKAAENAQDSDS